MALDIVLYLLCLILYVRAQLAWTSIYVDGTSQVDLWTQNAEGCQCPWDINNLACACCVKDGGCHCGMGSPNRCMQCGLEEHCSNMCNMTIDSMTLMKQSGKTFGQIKSPSIEGPSTCWYTFIPSSNQRVELQIYRLVSVGRFNGTNCEAGYLQLIAGRDMYTDITEFEICGPNERFAPPVVLFSDHGESMLIFQILEKTRRSQFLAHFSFTSVNNLQGLGYQPKGGTKLQNTICDWMYQDFSCRKIGTCILTSPGYPGVYPPRRQCKYFITTSSIHTHVQLTFNNLLLPHNHCDTDYLAIYQGSSKAGRHLHTFCGNDKKRQEVQYSGPNLLLEFNSGPPVPPFNYNGFLIHLEFTEREPHADANITGFSSKSNGLGIVHSSEETIKSNKFDHSLMETGKTTCDITVHENESRSGHFDTRSHEWSSICQFVFKGKPTDVVHISLFNYKLRSRSCNTVVEIFDGTVSSSSKKKPIHKICSPQTKYARDHGGSFLEHQTFVSTGPVLTLILKRQQSLHTSKDYEFVDGAYLFHDEQVRGTLQPSTICDVNFYGMSSPSSGTIGNPGSQHLYWNIEGPLKCSQQFIPGANQSIALTIRSLNRMSKTADCQTQCGDGGCVCVSLLKSTKSYDHLILISDEGQSLTCICGDFQYEWMPISVRSWGPISVVYSLAHYSWNTKGFEFSATYIFNNDALCGVNTVMAQSGEIKSTNITSVEELNYFYHQNCIWILDSNVERQLFIELSSNQNRPCSAWNLSVHEYSSYMEDRNHLGELLYTFCPRDKHKTYSLPWKLNTVIVRLRVMSRTLPQYKIKWKSQIVRANTRLANPTPVPNAISSGPLIKCIIHYLVLSLICTLHFFFCNYNIVLI